MVDRTPCLTWEAFVNDCAQAYEAGMSEHEFGSGLVGRSVCWVGIVHDVRQVAKQHTVPGISIQMPVIRMPVSSGHLEGSYVFLHLESEAERRKARALRKGDRVEFIGSFQKQVVFPSVSFDFDEEQSIVFLSFGLKGGAIV